MELIWSDFAKADYWENIDYLLEEWTKKDALHFIQKVDEYLKIITKNPKAFRITEYKNIHAVPIVAQITLFYQIVDNQQIELVRFWNNKKDPNKRKFY